MNIFDAFQLILPLFLIILLGWMLFKVKVATAGWVKVLNEFAFYIGLPTLSFLSLYTLDIRSFDSAIVLSNALFFAAALGVTFAVTIFVRTPPQIGSVVILSVLFGNIAYMGFPMNEMVFGAAGLSAAVVVCAIHNALYFIFAVAAAEYRSGRNVSYRVLFVKICKVPILWAVLLGVIFAYFQINLPALFVVPIKMLANASSAIVLLALGVFLATISFRQYVRQAMLITLLKLVALPLIFWLIALIFRLDPLHFSVSMLQAAMPVAISVFTIADNMGLDKELAASSVFITTLLSVVTLPVLVALLT